MENPRNAAIGLLNTYFGEKNLESPVDAACRLLDRIFIHPKSKSWTKPELIEPAFQIICGMNFDVDDLVENHLGVDLSIESLEEFDAKRGSPVFGIARPNSRRIAICERTLVYEPLYRSTMMHEVGHIILHASKKDRDYSYTPFARQQDNTESEANDFMRNILIPDEIFYLAVALTCEVHGIMLEESFQCANSPRGRWQWREKHLPFLINYLCVSRELILNLLRKKGVITDKTYRYHTSYPLPNRWLDPQKYRPLKKVTAKLMQALGMSN